MAKRRVAVIGSLNVDFITRTPRMPAAGETLTASSFDTGFGGKGANQAVACARLASEEVEVQMVGNVGDDSFGADYCSALERDGIDTSTLRQVEGVKTGIANIIVEEITGENRIMLSTGANHAFSKECSGEWNMVPPEADVVVLQLEIPLPVVLHNLDLASKSGIYVIFNPAPAVELPDAAYPCIDTLILNESEAAILSGHAQEQRSPEEQARLLLAKGVKDAVVVTLGSEGLVFVNAAGTSDRIPARKVTVVDTTAAGDTFVGAYAVMKARSRDGAFDLLEALNFATLAASKTVEKEGAMAAIPSLKEVLQS